MDLEIALDQIEIPGGRRAVDPTTVSALANRLPRWGCSTASRFANATALMCSSPAAIAWKRSANLAMRAFQPVWWT
jgi:hypothetical protein